MPVTTIPLEKAGDFFGAKVQSAIKKGAVKGLYSAALRMVNIIQTETIPAQIPEPSARGHYKAGWKADRGEQSAWYENTLPHASVVEYGALPANIKVGTKLINGLTEWIQIKGIASGPAAVRIAWAIAHTIASQVVITRGGRQQVRQGGGKGLFGGTGLRIMEKANERLESVIEEEVAREIERALR